MKHRMIFIVTVFVFLIGIPPVSALANETIYEVANFTEFQEAVEAINADTSDTTFTIKLKDDIDFGSSEYRCEFTHDTVILGNGHTIDLGNKPLQGDLLNGEIAVTEGATLSLGEDGGTLAENKLKIISHGKRRSHALIFIGDRNSQSTLNMYDGVEISGSIINGASLGSAVNIMNGKFNMYGGAIQGNTVASCGTYSGSAVAGDGRYGTVIFNMLGGSIHDNKTMIDASTYETYGFGGGVFLINGQFNMSGGSIKNNQIEKIGENKGQGYGGGIVLWGGEATLSGGDISNNVSSHFGGGIFAVNKADMCINEGCNLCGNAAPMGGGIYSEANIKVAEGAVIANNKASFKGDDIAHLDHSLTLADAGKMNAQLITDETPKDITGWYLDDEPRWCTDPSREADITTPIEEAIFLKAAYAYENEYTVAYRFVSDSKEALPREVLALLPTDKRTYQLGDSITPIKPEKREVPVANGMWIFKGYDTEDKTIATETTEFVGTWMFEPYMMMLNEAPVIHTDDKTIYVHDIFYPLEDVSATDKEDGDIILTDQNVIKNNVDTEKAGMGEVTYQVSDSRGATASKTIQVTVKGRPASPNHHDDNHEPSVKRHEAYLNGYGDKTLKPQNNITREEVAVMFSQFLQDALIAETNHSQTFVDVNEKRWSSEAIAYLDELGIIKGYPDHTFRPKQAITRAEFLAIAERFKPLQAGSKTFMDVPQNHWAYEIIKKGASAGWINGYPDGKFRPENSITRAEAVKISNKMLNRNGDKSFIDLHQDQITTHLDITKDHWAYYDLLEATVSHNYIRAQDGVEEVWKNYQQNFTVSQ